MQHSVLFRNEDEESIDSHKPSNIGSRISGKDKADAASSPESFESARDGVSLDFIYIFFLLAYHIILFDIFT